MDVFHGFLVVFLQKEGLPMLCSVSMPLADSIKGPVEIEDLNPWFLPVPSSICSISPGSNHDYMSTTYRVVISSLVMPDTTIDYDIAKKNFEVVHREEVFYQTNDANVCNADKQHYHASIATLGEFELPKSRVDKQDVIELPGKYVCERTEVPSHDGVLVPLTILYSQEARYTTQSPALLHGYGAYGEVLDKSWNPDRICLLDRGWTLAFADVRGGGGDNSWHEAGSLLNKLNSIYDFVACAKHMISEGYVHETRLCAIGLSAGGLLVGATINMYPDLFAAVILKVPFLDVCNTLLDSSLPLTMLDYEEFGDPRIESNFKMLRAYSPYDNISSEICPPPMLISAAFNDSRVGVWEAVKWVARLRDNSCFSCSKSVILKTNMSAGHFGESGRYQQCEEVAFEYAFLIKAVEKLSEATS